jgi:hypothetical protein
MSGLATAISSGQLGHQRFSKCATMRLRIEASGSRPNPAPMFSTM